MPPVCFDSIRLMVLANVNINWCILGDTSWNHLNLNDSVHIPFVVKKKCWNLFSWHQIFCARDNKMSIFTSKTVLFVSQKYTPRRKSGPKENQIRSELCPSADIVTLERLACKVFQITSERKAVLFLLETPGWRETRVWKREKAERPFAGCLTSDVALESTHVKGELPMMVWYSLKRRFVPKEHLIYHDCHLMIQLLTQREAALEFFKVSRDFHQGRLSRWPHFLAAVVNPRGSRHCLTLDQQTHSANECHPGLSRKHSILRRSGVNIPSVLQINVSESQWRNTPSLQHVEQILIPHMNLFEVIPGKCKWDGEPDKRIV